MLIVTAAAGGDRGGCLVGFAAQCSIDPLRFMVWISKKNHTFGVPARPSVLRPHFHDAASRGLAAVLAATGDRGRRAALRGGACYGAAAVVANLVVKPVVHRSRPPGAGKGRPGPVTSSFPSGHAATDLAFALAVGQEISALLL